MKATRLPDFPQPPGQGPAPGPGSPEPPKPQFRVVLFGTGKGKGRVFINGVELQHVRMVDVATTTSVNDIVRSRISIELVGEVIPIEYAPAGEPDETAP